MYIKIHFYLFLLLAYLFLIQKLEVFILFYISILLHELAHVVVALLLKVNVVEINLMPVGVCAVYNENIKSNKEIMISIAGPLISFLMAILSKDVFINNINSIIIFINLIPIYPLDGGRIIKNFFIIKYGYKKGIVISNYISDLFVVVLFAISAVFIICFKNFYLLFVAFYIYTVSKKEMKKERILGLINYLQNV